MDFLIDIHWKRRTPQPGKPEKGFSTFVRNARSVNSAKSGAVRKFNRDFGMHLSIERVAEKADPAGIFR